MTTRFGSAFVIGWVLVLGMNPASNAQEQSVGRCRLPPKMISAEPRQPPSTANLPAGTVVVEFTVTIDGSVRDSAVVESSNAGLDRWALEKSAALRFAPVKKACRSRFTLQHRITDTPSAPTD